MSRITNLFLLLTAQLIVLIIGCSGTSSPLEPVTDYSYDDRQILGVWDFSINSITEEIAITPNRYLHTHYNVTGLLSSPNCSDCIEIAVINIDPVTNVYIIDLSLKNPTSTLTAYDVRCTLLFPEGDNRQLVNADAHTTIFTGGVVSPFMAFGKGNAQRSFSPGEILVESLEIRFPEPENYYVTFAIDASFPANQEEPYGFSNTWLDGVITEDTSSSAWLYTTVSDWQDNISGVTLDLGFTVVNMEHNGNSEYKYYLTNSIGVPAGEYTLLIKANSEGASNSLYYKYLLEIVPSSQSYTVVDTGQDTCSDDVVEITCPAAGQPFHGQDAQYDGVQFFYQDNLDGTITDLNTGLMWQQNSDLVNKSTWQEAADGAVTFNLAGYTDWRLPSIKELYSLIDFRGSSFYLIPYIDTNYFNFRWGDESLGERVIDGQYWSSTEYVGTTMNNDPTAFGVNFADGRIKGYGKETPMGEMTQFVRYVRENPDYSVNNFKDNSDGTITDQSTGLIWQKIDDGIPRNWEEALAYAENLSLAGEDDWRLPNPKELQSIVDYTRAPDATDPLMRDCAIDPIFDVTEIESWFWTGTTLFEGPQSADAVYICFGQGFGWMQPPGGGDYVYMNVHGAGCQRSDPKNGDPNDWPYGRGPQGDEIRIYNYVRCVRGG